MINRSMHLKKYSKFFLIYRYFMVSLIKDKPRRHTESQWY